MSAKSRTGTGTSSFAGTCMHEHTHKSRTEYASRRMAAAVERMGDVSLTSREWELALRWATAWGMAMRTGPRCNCPEDCALRAETCGQDRSDRRFSGG